MAEQKYDIGTPTTLLFSDFHMVSDKWDTTNDNIYIVTSVMSTYSEWSSTVYQAMFLKISVTGMDIKKYGYFNKPTLESIAQDIFMDTTNLYVLIRHWDSPTYTPGAF